MDISLMTKIGILIIALGAGLSARYIFKKNDSHVEQIAENIIKDETGHDIDFSPDDKE